MSILIRLGLRLLFRYRWGPYVIAAVLIVAGLAVGLTSHQVTYQKADHVTISHYLSGSDDGKAYIQTSDGTLYVLTELDFTPSLSSDALQSRTATLIYNPDETETVAVDATNTSTHLDGTGATVVELISYANSTDTTGKAFVTSDYTQHPQGIYSNQWGGGAVLMLVGIALAAIFFFARKNSKNKPGYNNGANGISITPASAMAGGFQQQASYPPQATPYPQNPYAPQTPYPSEQMQAPYSQQGMPYPQNPYAPQATPPYPQAPYPSEQPQTPYPQAPYQQQGMPYPQAPYPQATPGSGQPDRYSTLPGALPSNPSGIAPTVYAPPPYPHQQ
ncbi:MAG TPA: hypothetical protein VL485_07380 [Ktedonobacteraceae bacterium]|nr:hypothetical protein [Ktedonobacteraceae bacterium]